jgi:hypothetical protein
MDRETDDVMMLGCIIFAGPFFIVLGIICILALFS